MIILIFSFQRKIIKFTVEKRLVKYYDDTWKEGIQIYPMDRLLVKKLTLSRKPTLSAQGLLIIDANNGNNLKEYNSCKTDEEIAEFIKRDCLLKGLVEIKAVLKDDL